MKFDYTEGKKATYMISVHWWNGGDQYYFGGYRKAKEHFNKLAENVKDGVSISLYDMKKDTKKDFVKGGEA